jgi:hypothetical protein
VFSQVVFPPELLRVLAGPTELAGVPIAQEQIFTAVAHASLDKPRQGAALTDDGRHGERERRRGDHLPVVRLHEVHLVEDEHRDGGLPVDDEERTVPRGKNESLLHGTPDEPCPEPSPQFRQFRREVAGLF